MNKVTEADSHYDSLEQMSTVDLLHNINNEDEKVARIVKQQIPSIVSLIEVIVEKLKLGGRLFYLGAGTSGRLGILDASECPPTFGVSHDLVIGLIAGGDSAIRKAVEFAEDNKEEICTTMELDKYKEILDLLFTYAILQQPKDEYRKQIYKVKELILNTKQTKLSTYSKRK